MHWPKSIRMYSSTENELSCYICSLFVYIFFIYMLHSIICMIHTPLLHHVFQLLSFSFVSSDLFSSSVLIFFFLKKTCFQHRNFSPHFFVHDKECRMYETKHKLLGGAESKSKKKKQILERACFPFFHCTVKWNRKATKK